MLKNIKVYFLIAIIATICYKEAVSSSNSNSHRDRIIGCLHSDVCTSKQFCFDDNAFGRCEDLSRVISSSDSDYVYQLDHKTIQLLESEVERLANEGFDWADPYTQCTLKSILNDRPRVVYDPSACDYLRPQVPYVDLLANAAADDDNDDEPKMGDNSHFDGSFLDDPQSGSVSRLPGIPVSDYLIFSQLGKDKGTQTSAPTASAVSSGRPKSKELKQQKEEFNLRPTLSITSPQITSSARGSTQKQGGGLENEVERKPSTASQLSSDTFKSKLLGTMQVKRTPSIRFVGKNEQRGLTHDEKASDVDEDFLVPYGMSDKQLTEFLAILAGELKAQKEKPSGVGDVDIDSVRESAPKKMPSSDDLYPYLLENAVESGSFDGNDDNPSAAAAPSDSADHVYRKLDQETLDQLVKWLRQQAPPPMSFRQQQIDSPPVSPLHLPSLGQEGVRSSQQAASLPEMAGLLSGNNEEEQQYVLVPIESFYETANRPDGGRQLLPGKPEVRVLRDTEAEEENQEEVPEPSDDTAILLNAADEEALRNALADSYLRQLEAGDGSVTVDVIGDDNEPTGDKAVQTLPFPPIKSKDADYDEGLPENDPEFNQLMQDLLHYEKTGEGDPDKAIDEYLRKYFDAKEGTSFVLERLPDGDPDEKNKKMIQDEMKELFFGDINYNNAFDSKMPNFARKHRYDIKKPGPKFFEEYFFKPDDVASSASTEVEAAEEEAQEENQNEPLLLQERTEKRDSLPRTESAMLPTKKNVKSIRSNKPVSEGPVKVDAKSENTIIIRTAEVGEDTNLEAVDSTHTYVITDRRLGEEASQKLVQTLEQVFKLPRGTFSNLRIEERALTFKVNPNYRDLNASQVASRIEDLSNVIKDLTGYAVQETGIGDKTKLPVISASFAKQSNQKLISLTVSICTVVLAILASATLIFFLRRNAYIREKVKGFMKISEDWMKFDYQDLCRQRMKGKGGKDEEAECTMAGTTGKSKSVDTTAANQQAGNDSQPSPQSRSSTSSWVEEPVSSNMDITTGHIILTYMEEHLKKKDKLDTEWEALCNYEADPCSANAAAQQQNASKNRCPDILPYDHSRVILNDLANVGKSDYINANTITDHDPRHPAYIVTQGVLSSTKADFWQMIWEQGSVTIVLLTRLRENGLNLCDRYWPEEGSEVYHNYEVNLISEHIFCDDYLVRSFYLKNLKTSETRTVTQFHYLSWPENGIPPNTKSILDFRRKVNKSYKGAKSCPMVVHCSDGIGRSGTYILIDMVLNRLSKGAKEIDIAASLEHLRDQRAGMVVTKNQFEFVLLAIAEEVQAILKALVENHKN